MASVLEAKSVDGLDGSRWLFVKDIREYSRVQFKAYLLLLNDGCVGSVANWCLGCRDLHGRFKV